MSKTKSGPTVWFSPTDRQTGRQLMSPGMTKHEAEFTGVWLLSKSSVHCYCIIFSPREFTHVLFLLTAKTNRLEEMFPSACPSFHHLLSPEYLKADSLLPLLCSIVQQSCKFSAKFNQAASRERRRKTDFMLSLAVGTCSFIVSNSGLHKLKPVKSKPSKVKTLKAKVTYIFWVKVRVIRWWWWHRP